MWFMGDTIASSIAVSIKNIEDQHPATLREIVKTHSFGGTSPRTQEFGMGKQDEVQYKTEICLKKRLELAWLEFGPRNHAGHETTPLHRLLLATVDNGTIP